MLRDRPEGVVGSLLGSGGGFLSGATIDIDFTTGRALGVVGAPSAYLTTTRATPPLAYVNDVVGNWTGIAPNLPRISNKGLLVEEGRTNSIRNNVAQGAVAGVVGSGGSLPTNWGTFTPITGTVITVVGTGTENGIDYVDLRFSGTASGAGSIDFYPETVGGIAASNGQIWSFSGFVTRVAGSNANISGVTVGINLYNSGAYLATLPGDFLVPATGALGISRKGIPATVNNASTTHALPTFSITVLAAGALDLTLRVGWPQMELGGSVTSPIRTTAAAVARAADNVLMTGTTAMGSAASFFAKGTPQAPLAFTGYQDIVAIDDGTAANAMVVFRNPTSGNVNGNNTVSSSNLGGPTATSHAQGVSGKMAFASSAGSQALSFNGATVVTSALAHPIGMNAIGLGAQRNFGWYNGFVERVAFWPGQRISNAQLQSITT